MKTIGERIKEFRGKTSRDEFAPLYDIHPNTLRRYEVGERVPDPDFLERLEQAGFRVKQEETSGKIMDHLETDLADDPNPLERENALLREMLALQKENGDLRVKAAQLEARNAELERQLAEALKPAQPAPMGGGMSKVG